MAKKKKYPKRPKQSASLAVWERYEDKVKAVDKYNSELDKRKAKKKALINKIKSKY